MANSLKWFVVMLLAAAVIAAAAGSRFFTDWLWFESLGYAGLFTGRLMWLWGLRVGSWLCFALVMFINLLIVKPAVQQALWRFYTIGQRVKARHLTLTAFLISIIFGLLYSSGLSGYYFEIAQF